MQQGKVDEGNCRTSEHRGAGSWRQGPDIRDRHGVLQEERLSESSRILQKSISTDPTNEEATQLLGSRITLADILRALPLLQRVQGWYPTANVDAAYILGVCYIQLKNYDQARKAFGKMFDVPSDSAAAYLFTARMLLRQEYDPVAEEYAQKAAGLDPKLPLVHFLLGELYIYKSRIPEAIAELQKELAINPADAATYYKLADAYSRVQKYDDAERLLQRSIWLDAGHWALHSYGKCSRKANSIGAKGLATCGIDGPTPTTHHLLGQAYRDLGGKRKPRTSYSWPSICRTVGTGQPA